MSKHKKRPRGRPQPGRFLRKTVHGKVPEPGLDALVHNMLHGERGVDWEASPDVIPYDWQERMKLAVPCPACDQRKQDA